MSILMLLLGIICESYNDVVLEYKKIECPYAKTLPFNNQPQCGIKNGSPLYPEWCNPSHNFFLNNYYQSLSLCLMGCHSEQTFAPLNLSPHQPNKNYKYLNAERLWFYNTLVDFMLYGKKVLQTQKIPVGRCCDKFWGDYTSLPCPKWSLD